MEGEQVAHFISEDAQARFLAAYDRAFAALWPAPWEEFDVETAFGSTHIHRYRAAQGEPVVLLHGAVSNGVEWYRHVAALGREHPVFALDLLGDPGRSIQQAPIRDPADRAAWLDEVLGQLGEQPAHLAGSSYGGWVALNQALRAPGRVASITLLDPAGLEKVGARFLWWLYVNGLAGLAPGFARKHLAVWLGNPVLVVPELRSVLYLGFRSFRHATSRQEPLTDDELRSIRVPALVLTGEHSPLVRPATARARGRLMPAAQVEIITGTGHGPGLERPDYANARITAFLAAAGKERGSVP